MRLAGLTPRLLNLGGGYPVRHVKPIPAIEKIAEVVNHGLRDLPQDVRVMAEPGRFLVSDAGYFVCRVVGTATRAGKRWMYLGRGRFRRHHRNDGGSALRRADRSSGQAHTLARSRSYVRLRGRVHA